MNHHLRFRQVHLDFHTSGQIPGIGLAFDKAEWQKTLKAAHVNSITLFAKCHHGWHYNQTEIGLMHPNLDFDLLRAQFDACKEIGINAPIYLSAGLDDAMMERHPEWVLQQVDPATGRVSVPSTINAGFRHVCFNSPYTEHLAEEIKEVIRQFPNCDGIFLDIINQPPCACEHCLKVMREHGLDPKKPEDLEKCAEMALEHYFQVATQAVMSCDSKMPLYHNCHLPYGAKQRLNNYYSHYELESLPTGGWGYDHFPNAAKYAGTLGFDYLGMTGKFHTTWGEFGGFKNPNALRYECAAMLAYGAKCSIGDQLHPSGKLDESTYRLIGKAYTEVEAKEAWCNNVHNVAEIALLPAEAVVGPKVPCEGDTGAGRLLLEGHFLFDIIDLDADFNKYKLLILPDKVTVDGALKERLDAYLAKGGRLLMTGTSGIGKDGKALFDIGGETFGDSPYRPDYALPSAELLPTDIDTPMVMYLKGQRLKVTTGRSLGTIYDPYFNRTDHQHFCSHQHTPYQPEATDFASGIQKGNIVYLSHPVFAIYQGWGCVPMAQYLRKVISLALGESMFQCNMPSTARVSLMDQPGEKRSILHLLYANIVQRGQSQNIDDIWIRGNGQVIEELMPLYNSRISIRPAQKVKAITFEPQGLPVEYQTADDGTITFQVDSFTCHQMVVLHY